MEEEKVKVEKKVKGKDPQISREDHFKNTKIPPYAKDGLHYDYAPLRSYNRFINFLIGARGCGKGYGFEEWAVRDFINSGHQFVYMRRFKNELNKTKKIDFFDAKLKEKYEGYKLEWSDKWGAWTIDGYICGYPYILSSAGQTKSGKEYQEVNKVAFDEFIIDKQAYHYLPDETVAFAEATISIARDRFCQFFLISNAMTWNNPYFVKYGIPYPSSDDVVATKAYALHKPSLKAYAEYMRTTPAGQAWAELDPEYSSYAFDNQSFRDTSDFIKERPKKSWLIYVLVINGKNIGVWIDEAQHIYCSAKYDPNTPYKFALNSGDHSEDTKLLVKSNPTVKGFVTLFKNGSVFFESQNIKSVVMDFLRKAV